MLSDLQLKYLVSEARKYTFIPNVNHNSNLIKKKNIKKDLHKTPMLRKNNLRLKISQIKKEFDNNKTLKSDRNKSLNKNIKKLIDITMFNTLSEIGSHYIKEKSIEKNKKIINNFNNNNLKSQILKSRDTCKNYKNSSENKKNNKKNNKKSAIYKLMSKNLIYDNNSLENNNRIKVISSLEHKNKKLNKDSDISRFKNQKHFTINNLFKNDIHISNNIPYNTNYSNNYNSNKFDTKSNSHINEYKTIQTSTTDTQTKLHSKNKNSKSNKRKLNLNRFNNHSISFVYTYLQDNGANTNLNIINNKKKNNGNKRHYSFKTLDFSRDISDRFSLLFNNYLKNKKKTIPHRMKKNKIKNNNIQKLDKIKNSNININNSVNKLETINNINFNSNYLKKNNTFNDYNIPDNNCYFIRQNNEFLYTNSKEILFDLSNIEKSRKINNNLCKNYNTLDQELGNKNNGFSSIENSNVINKRNFYRKFPIKVMKNNKKIINNKDTIKRDILPELNKTENINTFNNNTNELKIENFYFNSLCDNNIKMNTNYKKFNKQKNEKKNSLQNIIGEKIPLKNNQKIIKQNLNNYIYIKNKRLNKFNNRNDNNKNNEEKIVKKNEIGKNIIIENIYNTSYKEDNGIEKDLNFIDKMSAQSMSDSKIYELANNYMDSEEIIDKNQVNTILYNKKGKNI